MLRRNTFRKRFEELLCRYVQDPNVVQFGSAVTGLGTNDSDIDLCLLFKDDTTSPMNEFVRDGNTLLSCPPEHFQENPIHRDELNALSLRGVPRVTTLLTGFFTYLVELSVNNKIGCQKSACIGALVKADQSGLLRKLILGLRLWAASNGVFSSEKKRTWNLNSYTLNLMFFSFLQSEKLLPAFAQSEKASPNGTVNDFTVPPYNIGEADIRKLFKKFFVLCVERQLDKTLFSLRNGGLVPLDDFKEQLILKTPIYSFCAGEFCLPLNKNENTDGMFLCTQDPIELTDNVAKNVTSKALKTMRHAMMLSLAAMKQNARLVCCYVGCLEKQVDKLFTCAKYAPDRGSCRASGFPEGFDEGTAESLLSIILSAILYCENPATPAKRTRFDCKLLTLTTPRSISRINRAKLGKLPTWDLSQYIKRLWMSRRALRKKWSGLLKPEEQFPLLIEALVSMSLKSTASNDCTLQFQTLFDVHKDSLWVGLKLIEGETVDVANVAHFMEQMLTKTRDYLQNGNAGMGHMSLDEFTAQVRAIFDREKDRLK
ncbi:nucleotidyltransferase domain protein [Cooperia oncophora]